MALGLRGFGYGRKLSLPMDQAIVEVKKLMEQEQFEVVQNMDLAGFVKKHFDAETAYSEYLLFSLYNPQYVKEILEIEPHLGLISSAAMIVYKIEDQITGVSVIDPISQIRVAAMGMRTSEQGKRLKVATSDLDRKFRLIMRSMDQWKVEQPQ